MADNTTTGTDEQMSQTTGASEVSNDGGGEGLVPEARETLNKGSESVAEGTEGVADRGRDPEYYAADHDPATSSS